MKKKMCMGKGAGLVLGACMLTAAVLLAGCGQKPEETAAAEPAAEPTEAVIEIEDETGAEEVPEVKEDIPPEEGMVRSSLTHQWVTQEEYDKRPLAVMYPIDKKAQPQYGINRAEVFYEILEEGDMSRQMGILVNWEDLERLGNIRSIRDYYVTIGLEWDPIFVHAGGPEVFVKPILTREDVDNLNGVGGVMGPEYGAFYRIPKGSRSEHTLYTDGEHVEAALEKAGFARTHREMYQPEHFNFVFGDEENDMTGYADTYDAFEIDMRGSFPVTKSSYLYNAEDKKYYRSIYGEPQKDAADDVQLSFDNILVECCAAGERGLSYKIFHTIDKGHHGYFITRGKMIPVLWEKEDDYSPTRFYDGAGNEVVLNTGRTMIHVYDPGRGDMNLGTALNFFRMRGASRCPRKKEIPPPGSVLPGGGAVQVFAVCRLKRFSPAGRT